MAMLNWQGWAANWLGWGSEGVAPPTPPPASNKGAGRSSKARSRRVLVTIDDKTYEVSSEQQARQLIERAAQKAVKKAAKTPQKPASKPVAPSVSVEVPRGADADLGAQIRAFVDSLVARMPSVAPQIYAPAPVDDDEDAIIALILED